MLDGHTLDTPEACIKDVCMRVILEPNMMGKISLLGSPWRQ